MGLFRKKITATELGEILAKGVMTINEFPIYEIDFLKYLVENTQLYEASARFELICLLAVIFDNAVLAYVPNSQREDVLKSLYYNLKISMEKWTGDYDETEKNIVIRIGKYHEALETGQLASGTPAITRALMDMCLDEEEEGMEDYIYFTSHTMACMEAYTKGAYDIINQFKLK